MHSTKLQNLENTYKKHMYRVMILTAVVFKFAANAAHNHAAKRYSNTFPNLVNLTNTPVSHDESR
ncbi:hypothetical protein D918_03885 [Trichuris suis]|nr:hypothetical protein D918_03885 [Trichuris suis]